MPPCENVSYEHAQKVKTEEAIQHQGQDQHYHKLNVKGLNDMSTLVRHFVSSPREREKRDRRGSRDETEGQGRKRKMNESEETIHPLPLPAARIAALPDCKPI